MTPRLALALLAAALLAAASHTAQAAPVSEVVCRGDGTRVALLIGNQDYVGSMQPLDNPRRDIGALGGLLCQHGFTVFRHADLDVSSFDATIGAFARAAKGTKTALVYYSGHGFAVGRRNWLVPVDARLGCEDISGDGSDVTLLKRRLIDLDEDVLSRLEGAGDQIVILDACRTDPVKGCRGGAAPSLVKGLVRTSASNARLIVYATQDGQVALDRVRGSETSPLITAMLKRLPENPRRDWVTAMLAVSAEVHALTERKQRPNIDVSLAPQGCLALECGAPAVVTPQPPPVAPVDPDAAARRDFEFAERQNSREVWEEFLRKHPTGLHAAAARQRLALLIPRAPDVPPPRPDAPPPSQLAVVAPPVPPAPPATPVQPAAGVFPPAIKVDPLSPARERALKPKDTFKECDVCPEMVVVPSGSFMMGSPASEAQRSSDEGPEHRVTISRQFAVAKFAVTFEEWDACVADGGCNDHRPSDRGWGRGRRPVINVSWDDAKAYVAWLSRKTGRTYRLLSEAEREYVARAGTTTPFWWGSTISTSRANYDGTFDDVYGSSKGEYRQQTVPVDSFQPNPWGLYQVHGNVWEWVEDCYKSGYSGAPTDGSAWTSGDCSVGRVLRGGSWNRNPSDLRSASRLRNNAVGTDVIFGFRVARTLEQGEVTPRRTEAPAPSQLAVVVPPVPPATPPAPTQPAVGVFPPAIKVDPLSPARERTLKPKDTFTECDACPEMIVVPAGSFMMGSPASEKERSSHEGPQHRVAFARQFAVGRFAVTFDQFAAFVQETGYKARSECTTYDGVTFDKRAGPLWFGSHPAGCISWGDAKAYVAWLSRKTSKTYRLLSEAEWEYVARAGSTSPFWWGSTISTSQANYDGNYSYGGGLKGEFRRRAMPVDSFEANPWGLYQVHGNIYEWTEDCGNNGYRGAPSNGTPWTSGDCSRRVLRNASWHNPPAGLRSAARNPATATSRSGDVGFRVARTLAP